MKRLIRLLASAVVLAPIAALAQGYPFQTPTYIPTVTVPSATLSAATITAAPVTVPLIIHGGTALIRIGGTFTGLSATVQIASERTSPTYTSVSVEPLGGSSGATKTITAAGLYRLNTNGAAQAQLTFSALATGSVSYDVSIAPDSQFHSVSPFRRVTYSTSFSQLTPAASLTDLITIAGNATTTVRFERVECWGTATANGVGPLALVKRSVADSVATPTPGVAVPHDALDPAASSVPASYAANPTLGAAVGTLRQGTLTYSNATTTTLDTAPLVWTFGDRYDEEPILRGTAQVLAINGVATSVPSGGVITCNLTWTEN